MNQSPSSMEAIVVSLSTAKALKEAGWEHKTPFKWVNEPGIGWVAVSSYSDGVMIGFPWLPAPTATEIAEVLPKTVKKGRDTFGLVITNQTTDGVWIADYIVTGWGQPYAGHKEHWLHYGDDAKYTEAFSMQDALAKLWIKLHETLPSEEGIEVQKGTLS